MTLRNIISVHANHCNYLTFYMKYIYTAEPENVKRFQTEKKSIKSISEILTLLPFCCQFCVLFFHRILVTKCF